MHAHADGDDKFVNPRINLLQLLLFNICLNVAFSNFQMLFHHYKMFSSINKYRNAS